MKNKYITKIKKIFPISLKDIAITLFILLCVIGACSVLKYVDKSDAFVPMVFILAVFLVSRYTNGYFFGIASAIISVLAVNFLFTYPYFRFNFTLSGYPLAMMCTLVVAIVTSALTTQTKLHATTMLEIEREKTRANLLRAVSHDLRTPLTSILGASSAIIENDEKLSAEQRIKLLSEINEDAQWLIRMVENLLSITKINSDGSGARLVKSPEAVEEVVAEAVTKFRKRFEDSVTVTVPEEFLLVPMDAMLVEQVIINLLENAVIHGVQATEITLSAVVSGSDCLFTVSDNGVGIASSAFPHLFDGYFNPKYEKDGDTKRNMGIGLSVCNSIVIAHGGRMSAKNNSNGGASFSFTIPLEV